MYYVSQWQLFWILLPSLKVLMHYRNTFRLFKLKDASISIAKCSLTCVEQHEQWCKLINLSDAFMLRPAHELSRGVKKMRTSTIKDERTPCWYQSESKRQMLAANQSWEQSLAWVILALLSWIMLFLETITVAREYWKYWRIMNLCIFQIFLPFFW